MSRREVLVFGAFTCAATGFVLGALAAVVRGWGSPLVFVAVQNDTDTEIQSVTLRTTSCGLTTGLATPVLTAGQAHTFRFPVCGEGGYQLEAVLPNGTALKSEAYVESGYSVSAHLELSRIRTTSKAYHL